MVLRNEKYEDITVSTVYIIDTINQTHSLQLLWYYIFLLIKWYYIIDFVVNYFWHNKIMGFYFMILSMNTKRLSPCHWWNKKYLNIYQIKYTITLDRIFFYNAFQIVWLPYHEILLQHSSILWNLQTNSIRWTCYLSAEERTAQMGRGI